MFHLRSVGSAIAEQLHERSDGHGTDVSGIAAAAAGNGLGFTGAGGNAVIYGYRVFPTPDTSCGTQQGNSDAQCGATTIDIADAIDDAVTQGANVISMSLGGGGCVGGVDEDTVENTAVTNALAHNVIVVAAAGNSGSLRTGTLTAPACIANVIAVGATGLDDGVMEGTGYDQPLHELQSRERLAGEPGRVRGVLFAVR